MRVVTPARLAAVAAIALTAHRAAAQGTPPGHADTLRLTRGEARAPALRANPELGAVRLAIGVARGEFRQEGLIRSNPAADLLAGGQGAEIGLTQEIEVAGQRGARRAAGEISRFEFNRATVELGRARSRLLATRRERDAASSELRRLLALSPAQPLVPVLDDTTLVVTASRATAAVRAEIAKAIGTYETAEAEAEVLESTVLGPARENRRLLEIAYREGKVGLPVLLLIRNQVIDAELDYWTAWLAAREARADLAQATGETVASFDPRAPVARPGASP